MIFENSYAFAPVVMLRTPAYSFKSYEGTGIQLLVKTDFFRAALISASQSLYNELARVNFDYQKLDHKAKGAILKYFNRMCYRPTPFGLFAGFSSIRWGEKNNIIFSDHVQIHTQLNFAESVSCANELINEHLKCDLRYMVNDTLYRLPNEYRYVRSEYDSEKSKRVFYLHSLERSKAIDDIIQFLQQPESYAAILSFILLSFKTDEKTSCEFLDWLKDEQVLLQELRANITGTDYLQRIINLSAIENQDISALTSKEIETLVSKTNGVSFYINLQKETVKEILHERYQQQLLTGLYALNKLLPAIQSEGLQHFKTAFLKKFDRRSIPLMEALDPELGAGYEALATRHSLSYLLKNITIEEHQHIRTSTTQWTLAHAMLFQKWNSLPKDNTIIQLDKSDLQRLSEFKEDNVYPPSFSVIFRVLDDKVFLEQAGGVTATSILGRFTPFSKEIFASCKEIAEHEQNTNPDIIYAEIAHFSEDHAANIERRQNVREYEIPILTCSVVNKEYQLPLSDLWVCVKNERIVLWSKKQDKEVIPRLSSSYNYQRNDLAVFRFLCDLQYQNLKASQNFDLAYFFPDLQFYPRTEYENVILQLANWRILSCKIGELYSCKSESQKVALLKTWATESNWPQYIALRENDNELIFNTHDEQQLSLLANNFKTGHSAVITEYPFMGTENQLITDLYNAPYACQFIASLYHSQEAYPKLQSKPELNNYFTPVKRKFIPGSEWIYCKLYCQPDRSNELLIEHITTYLDLLQSIGKLKKWFFIRYRDPDYHLRIRLNIDPHDGGDIIHIFNRRFAGLVQAGLINDLKVEIYERELERYSPFLIEPIESLFCESSLRIAEYLKSQSSVESANYQYFEFSDLHCIMEAFDFGPLGKSKLCCQLYESLSVEYENGKSLNEQMKRKFREVKDVLIMALERDKHFKSIPFYSSLLTVHKKSRKLPFENRRQLVADIMHMHLNRLFVDDARKQEMIIYYCLWRHYQSAVARNKQAVTYVH